MDDLSERFEIGKRITIYTNNGFKFSGEVIAVFKGFVEILDEVKGYKKIIKISEINEVNL